ncbi:MAG: DUF4430 domain-containing protein [Oscillospiraceae bacterium]|nr:DUF4430 domain-containing protein [Oscillospiraceae bacterium]
MKKQRKLIIAAVAVLLCLAVIFTAVWLLTKQKPVEGEKDLHIDVVVGSETVRTLDFHTDALYLRQALEEQNLIGGEETSLGLKVMTVNGRTADESKQEWWCITKGGEWLNAGVDETPVEDGDRFELTLTVGW